METATLTFEKRIQAQDFSIAWSRFTGTGHVIWAGIENVTVRVTDVDDKKKEFINNYININN